MVATRTFDGIDALHENQQRAASQGTGHVDGCEVTLANNTTAIELSIASGSVRIEDSGVNVGSNSVTLSQGDGQFPRKDVITANSNGGIAVYEGTPRRPDSASVAAETTAVRRTAQPAPDDLAAGDDWADHVVLAIVWVPRRADSSDDLNSGDVWQRTVSPVRAGAGAVVHDSVSKTGDGSSKRFTLSHSFGTTPTDAQVEPTTSAASTDFWEVDVTATDVTIKYAAAPANGAALGWSVTTIGEASAREFAVDTPTASGDGTATRFTVAHSLTELPTVGIVTAASVDARGVFGVDPSSFTRSDLVIEYDSAPPSGTDNLTWHLFTR